MQIEVLFFARLRELAGSNSRTIELPEGSCVADALASVETTVPEVAGHLGACRAALDEEFVRPDVLVRPGSVLAIIPPVSGG